ncbi:MAG: YdcF family protein [Syntrophobacteraceae bacterium]|jgi:hypothetical protein
MKLVKRKELWVPTWWGWVLIVFTAFVMAACCMRNIHSFLSISEPVQAQILAVDEWMPPQALEKGAREFQDHGYSLLAVLGNERGWVVPTLRKAGVDESKIVAIQSDRVQKDRTFASAVALKKWLLSSGAPAKAINVMTLGPHARRSRQLFRKALGPDFTVGIISCVDPYYDPERWWESSEGFKAVIDETLAYIYTRLFFFPAAALK